MPITFTPTFGTLNKFKRTALRLPHQVTFETSLKDFGPFVEAILCPLQPIQSVQITICEIIFEPRKLNALMDRHGLSALGQGNTKQWHDWSLVASGEPEVRALLTAVVSEAINFALTPTPKKFLAYADHDDFMTFFGAKKSNLNGVVTGLEKLKIQQRDYQRRF
jgi:hypothetical protein